MRFGYVVNLFQSHQQVQSVGHNRVVSMLLENRGQVIEPDCDSPFLLQVQHFRQDDDGYQRVRLPTIHALKSRFGLIAQSLVRAQVPDQGMGVGNVKHQISSTSFSIVRMFAASMGFLSGSDDVLR